MSIFHPRANSICVFVATMEDELVMDKKEHIWYLKTLLSGDKDKEEKDTTLIKYSQTPIFTPSIWYGNLLIDFLRADDMIDVTLEKPAQISTVVTEKEEYPTTDNTQLEILWLHYHLGNFYFNKIQPLTALGVLLWYLLTFKPPICTVCLYYVITICPLLTKFPTSSGIHCQFMDSGKLCLHEPTW